MSAESLEALRRKMLEEKRRRRLLLSIPGFEQKAEDSRISQLEMAVYTILNHLLPPQ